MTVIPRLLVSVRSASEALAALAGGADLIDVKEPARGSLGRADDETIAAVVQAVAGQRPVSAALGELVEAAPCQAGGLAYVKWGLAAAAAIDWPALLQAASQARQAADPACQPVVAAYADWQRAQAPPLAAVADFACRHGCILLVDTCVKDGASLLDCLSLPQIAGLIERCRRAAVPVALAGSLGHAEIAKLLPYRPDWFAVRGAACQGGRRDQAIDVEKVSALKRWLGEPNRVSGQRTSPGFNRESKATESTSRHRP